MSLASINKINEEGIRFRSHLDGREMLLTPKPRSRSSTSWAPTS